MRGVSESKKIGDILHRFVYSAPHIHMSITLVQLSELGQKAFLKSHCTEVVYNIYNIMFIEGGIEVLTKFNLHF